MKWSAVNTQDSSRTFEIKHDSLVGYYLYVFENGKCINDHLQDSLKDAFEFAERDYMLPKSFWKKID